MPRMIVARMIFPLTVQHRSKEIGSLSLGGSGSENSIRRQTWLLFMGSCFFLRKFGTVLSWF